MFWKLPVFGKISKIGITPPRPDPDRRGLAVVLIVRNEERHIDEWAEFHRYAGVSHFIVYDNGCADLTIPKLRYALEEDMLTVIPWRQVFSDARMGREIHNQVLAYAHAASNFGRAFRWMTFIDVDEFLIPTHENSLPAALARVGDQTNISLPWHMFGRNGHLTPPHGGVLRNYLRRAADPMSDVRGIRAFKCIVDPCHLTALRVHSMETDGSDRTANDRGEVFDLKARDSRAFYSTDHIQLNHYYARSEEELQAKIGRGPNLVAKSPEYARKVRRTVENIEADEVEDRTALAFLNRIGA